MNCIKRLVISILVVVVALAGTELLASAQNSNSSTTMNGNMSMQSDNSSGTNMNRAGRRRGGRRNSQNSNASAGTSENTNTAGAAEQNANGTGATIRNTRGRRRGSRRVKPGESGVLAPGEEIITDRPVGTGRCDPNKQEQTDLSGTYTGKVGYSDAGLSGDATLTINGNNFTLTTGQVTEEGRIVAVTTCNYTAATMQFGKTAAAAPGQSSPATPLVFSLTVKRTAGGLNLTTAPGEMKQFSFTSHGGGAGGTRRTNRRSKRVAIKPPTVANNIKNAN
ncbi:MAG: hypothetical protein M3362_17815 [Acidobacteriota bacterium]|nr:hypothetical protein [Acidobacteriota bacterium]